MLRIDFSPVSKTYRAGDAPDAPTFEYLEQNAGILEDAATAAGDTVAKTLADQRRRMNEELWGRLLVGWTGLEDVRGEPVPVDAPEHVVAECRATLGEKATPEAIADRARGVWRYAVLRSLPSKVKTRLQVLTQAGEEAAARALGN